ncbi:MAG TPA: M1 family aminopeptidase [Anaerolineales bacterium]|nr:M1 family aminopeptidase [Anaerolineales bacterium]
MPPLGNRKSAPPGWGLRYAPKIGNRKFLAAIAFIFVSACSTPPAATPTFIIPTPIVATPLPPTAAEIATETATAVPAPDRAQYSINAVMDYANKSVVVDETILYPDHAAQPLTDLMLAVEPNFWQDCFTLKSLSLNDTAVTNYTLDGQKLSFPLPDVMQPGQVATIQISYTLNLPKIEPTNPNLSRPRIFGYSDLQINLVNWYPFVVPNLNGQWVLHDPWYYGEHLVYDAADYVVNLKQADPAVQPVIAASAPPAQNGEWTQYTLTAGRAFVIAASTSFITAATQVGDITVTSYYLQQMYQGAGQAAMTAAAQAIQIYTQRYGPYPHKSLAVVMGDFNDGMEFSGFFYLSRDFYSLYDGTTKSYLVFVAAHETAHQWWFEQVADDQALQPWLDEALATYSEHIFYEGTDPSLVSWWWTYRVDFFNPQGWVDIPIYAGNGFRPYTNAVYFRGAHFLDDLRTRIGDEAFFAFLKDYLAQENGKIASANDFFNILKAHTTVDYSDIVRQYFQNVY